MLEMEEKIRTEGRVLPGGILKVGSFLNQQIDTGFLRAMGREIARLYASSGVTKILTIEASGIAIAAAAAMELGVPMLFAKKHKTSNVDGTVYSTVVQPEFFNTCSARFVAELYKLKQRLFQLKKKSVVSSLT